MAVSPYLENVLRNLILNQAVATELLDLLNNVAASNSTGYTWRPPVVAVDALSTVLPTSAPVIVDGVTIQNGDRVLYTNLTNPAQNNQVYQVFGLTGVLVTFLNVDSWPGVGLANDGDALYVEQGASYGGMIFIFDGTRWNGYSPNGTPLSPSLVIDDNQIAPATLFGFDATDLKSVTIQYSIVRGTSAETGSLLIASNDGVVGYSAYKTDDGTDSGVTLSVTQSDSNISIQYVSTATGNPGAFRYIQTNLTE